MLMSRHKKCIDLKARCDRSSTLNDKEMALLRTDIKVSSIVTVKA